MADRIDQILEKLENLENRISAIEQEVRTHPRTATQFFVAKVKEEPDYPYNPDFGR